jgi:nitrile hydratase subunit beta
MDGIHDMGGMHGFGRVDLGDDSAFHEAWEKRVLGVRMATIMSGHGHADLRAYIEAIPAATYLSSRYYERWARALEAVVIDAGLVTPEEVADRAGRIDDPSVTPPDSVSVTADAHDEVASTLSTYVGSGADVAGRLRAGDRVRIRRMSPGHHTRCPRYVRGAEGVVERICGGFARPDPGDHPVEQIYTVRFDMRDLWGDDAEAGFLYLDLWEGYIE